MANKTATKSEVSSGDVNKSRLIQDILAVSPDRSPKDIAEELTAMGIPTTPNYVSTIKTNLKNKAGAPKRKTKAKKAAPKAPQAPQAAKQTAVTAPSVKINFEELKMAKDMARQLGGVEKAREVLSALMQLSE